MPEFVLQPQNEVKSRMGFFVFVKCTYPGNGILKFFCMTAILKHGGQFQQYYLLCVKYKNLMFLMLRIQ